ncbi:helix-turn-helix domain-containing protein [Nocardia sp. NPDC004722]
MTIDGEAAVQITATPLAHPGARAGAHQPARERRKVAPRTWACERPEIGVYLRRRREELGLTQEEVASAASTTLSSLRKWEAGLRNPSVEGLAAWCRVLNPPDWMLRKITSLALGGLDGLEGLRAETSTPIVAPDDLDHLEAFSGPAYYLAFPQLDVLAANSAARRLAPGLIPAAPGADRPVNVVEWIMTDAARGLIVNWKDTAIRAIHALRVMGPGLVPQARLDDIFNACYDRSPMEFKRFFAAAPADHLDGDELLLRDPVSGATDRYTCRSLRSMQPLRPYELVQLARGASALN